VKTFVYVGNWDRHKSGPNGFGICRYDASNGGLQVIKSVFPEITVGAACIEAQRGVLYCTDEYDTLPGNFLGGGGQVYAFRIDRGSGDLIEINHCPSYGTLPSSLTLGPDGKHLIVTHHTDRVPVTKVVSDGTSGYRIALDYDDATTVLFPLAEDGSINDPCDVHKHSGNGGPLPKQTHPQLHSVTRSPSGALFVVCDKGNDEIVLFNIDADRSKLRKCGTTKSFPGSSPRYSAFHPRQPYLFVNHETKAVVTSFRYREEGVLEPICSVSALATSIDDDPSMHQSDIAVHPSGKYVYSMVRGNNSVAGFRIDEQTGMLVMVQTAAIDGEGPRGFSFSPDGRFLIIAALTSREVLTYAVDERGVLSATGKKIEQPNPGSITFFNIT
jgi:6-phosphogluconolactonase (cycloisomerase 2 family)